MFDDFVRGVYVAFMGLLFVSGSVIGPLMMAWLLFRGLSSHGSGRGSVGTGGPLLSLNPSGLRWRGIWRPIQEARIEWGVDIDDCHTRMVHVNPVGVDPHTLVGGDPEAFWWQYRWGFTNYVLRIPWTAVAIGPSVGGQRRLVATSPHNGERLVLYLPHRLLVDILERVRDQGAGGWVDAFIAGEPVEWSDWSDGEESAEQDVAPADHTAVNNAGAPATWWNGLKERPASRSGDTDGSRSVAGEPNTWELDAVTGPHLHELGVDPEDPVDPAAVFPVAAR